MSTDRPGTTPGVADADPGIRAGSFVLRFSLTQGSFTVAPDLVIEARAVALYGPSGSGKTSILEAVGGLRTPQRGRIVVNDRVFFDKDAHTSVPVRDRRVGYVPQDVLLFPHLSVAQNIEYGTPRPTDDGRHGTGRAHVDRDELADLLGLDVLRSRRVAGLSGGERQRVALARALHTRPDVLLLDEPLAAVDLRRRRAIIDTLVAIRDELQLPLLYVTHSPDEARAIADYAVVLDEGRVVAAGKPAEVLI